MKRTLTLLFACLFFMAGLLAQAPRIPLVEHFTNTRCSLCPSGNRVLFRTLDSIGADALHIAYHSRTPYTSCIFYQHNRAQADARRDRYRVGATPQAMLNGTFNGAGSGMLTVNENTAAAQGGSPLGIEVQSRWLPGDTLEAGVNIAFVQNLPAGSYALFVAIVEEHIAYNAPNGESDHRNVFRAMLPGNNGEILPSLPAGQQTGFYTYKIAKHPDWNQNEIRVIAFVQNTGTDEVVNSGTVGSFSTAVEPGMDPGIRLAPNPANTLVRIDWSGEAVPLASLSLQDLSGRTLRSAETAAPGHELNLAGLAKGIYLIRLQAEGLFWTRKLVIQ